MLKIKLEWGSKTSLRFSGFKKATHSFGSDSYLLELVPELRDVWLNEPLVWLLRYLRDGGVRDLQNLKPNIANLNNLGLKGSQINLKILISKEKLKKAPKKL